MRILCLIPDLGMGGAQRAMVGLVRWLAVRHQIILMTYQAVDAPRFHDLPASVRVIPVNLLGGKPLARLWRLFRRPLVIRSLIVAEAPTVVLSFMDTMNIAAVAAAWNSGVPAVVSERTDPNRHRLPRWQAYLRLWAYKSAAKAVVQTEQARAYFAGPLARRMVVLPNPVPPSSVLATPALPGSNGRFRIIGLGRLGFEKGFDRLLQAFAQVAPRHPQWDLVIFGEGEEGDALRQLASSLGLEGRVRLPGATRLAQAELAASHIMAVPSRYEGFPNALAEAVGVGLPAIAFDGLGGAGDLIRTGETGILVPDGDVDAFAAALDRLMADGDLRRRMGQAASLHAAAFSPDKIYGQWEALLADVSCPG